MEDQKVYEVAATEVNQQMAFLAAIEKLAANPNVDVEKIQRIMDMQEQVLNRNAKQAFNAAMTCAQMAMPVVVKDRKNEQTRSNYAGYDNIVETCQPVYTKEGFSISFYQGSGCAESPLAEGYVRVCADIMHSGGHTKTRHIDIPVETTGIKGNSNMTKTHATGSAFQYGKGYLIRLIFNIPTGDDDDGNRAGGAVCIDDKQVSTLTDMLNDKGITSTRLLKYMGVDSLEKIVAADYEKAVGAIKMTPAKKEA
jgi:hypothetical protein